MGDLNVEVVLVDKRNNKMAVWYAEDTPFVDHDHWDGPAIMGLRGKKTIRIRNGTSFDHGKSGSGL